MEFIFPFLSGGVHLLNVCSSLLLSVAFTSAYSPGSMFSAWEQLLDTTEEESSSCLDLASSLLDTVSMELLAHTARKKLLFKKVRSFSFEFFGFSLPPFITCSRIFTFQLHSVPLRYVVSSFQNVFSCCLPSKSHPFFITCNVFLFFCSCFSIDRVSLRKWRSQSRM